MKTETLFSSKKQDWQPPDEFFSRLDEEFGFTLDACADASNHKCDRYYTESEDGLKQCWAGERVFCNPPYSDVKRWVEKCSQEVTCGCECAVMLIPARTDTKWFHDYIYHKAEIRFVKGRLRFSGHTVNAPFPSMVVVFREEINGNE